MGKSALPLELTSLGVDTAEDECHVLFICCSPCCSPSYAHCTVGYETSPPCLCTEVYLRENAIADYAAIPTVTHCLTCHGLFSLHLSRGRY